jgi:hypothetical protein
MKILLSVFLVIIVLMLGSCGFFRSIGLYNVPPNYSETYEEITGKKFIDHQNKKDNLRLTLVALKKEYSPFEEIELKLKVENISNADTMYLYEPGLYPSAFYTEIVIRDNLGKKQKVLEETYSIDYTVIVDDYGRRINPTIAPNHAKLAPGDSITKVLSFKTGKRICDNVECRLTFNRENIPGNYTAYYIQNNEEYDDIKGPIPTKITSSETVYSVSNYTKEELAIREKVNEIISAVFSEKNSSIIDSLYINFNDKYSDNIYAAQLKAFLELYSSVRKNRKN